MSAEQNYGKGNLKLTMSKTLDILKPYVSARFMEQVKGVWFIIFYLIAFQIVVLQLPIVYSLMISLGITTVIIGLMFFMEGLMLGLMPFGEVIGSKLPKKSKLPVILGFAFLLGLGATFAEPAIAVLKQAGAGVKPNQAPLLYSLLNDFSNQLVFCVGAGVGLAVLLGVLRFLYGWSLKVFIIPLVLLLSGLTIWPHMNDTLFPIIGLAWDCGAVTTGPVTVPLVLALGIGVCRIVSSGDSGGSGFGVVTLASLFPIIAVLLLGTYHYKAEDYYGANNYEGKVWKYVVNPAETVLVEEESEEEPTGFTEEEFERFNKSGNLEGEYDISFSGQHAIYDKGEIVLTKPRVTFKKKEALIEETREVEAWNPSTKVLEQLQSAAMGALQAIIPLCLFLLLTIKLILREKVPRADEISLGIVCITYLIIYYTQFRALVLL